MTNCKTIPQTEHHGFEQERGRAGNSKKLWWGWGWGGDSDGEEVLSEKRKDLSCLWPLLPT